MPITNIIFLAAVIAAFTLFGVVLAWGDYQTRKPGRQGPAEPADDDTRVVQFYGPERERGHKPDSVAAGRQDAEVS